ncbi:hypothetical protein N9137_00975 [Pseudomonadales bacterium]|nr:hypothetical protein [Pseudomonadales bacterium]
MINTNDLTMGQTVWAVDDEYCIYKLEVVSGVLVKDLDDDEIVNINEMDDKVFLSEDDAFKAYGTKYLRDLPAGMSLYKVDYGRIVEFTVREDCFLDSWWSGELWHIDHGEDYPLEGFYESMGDALIIAICQTKHDSDEVVEPSESDEESLDSFTKRLKELRSSVDESVRKRMERHHDDLVSELRELRTSIKAAEKERIKKYHEHKRELHNYLNSDGLYPIIGYAMARWVIMFCECGYNDGIFSVVEDDDGSKFIKLEGLNNE